MMAEVILIVITRTQIVQSVFVSATKIWLNEEQFNKCPDQKNMEENKSG
jgi:hypothetical protein